MEIYIYQKKRKEKTKTILVADKHIQTEIVVVKDNMAIFKPIVITLGAVILSFISILLLTWIFTYLKKRANDEKNNNTSNKIRDIDDGEINIYNGIFEDPALEKSFQQWEKKLYLNTSLKMAAIFLVGFPIFKIILSWIAYENIQTQGDKHLRNMILPPNQYVSFLRQFPRISLGIGCLLSAYSDSYKKKMSSEWYAWVQEIFLPCWLYVFFHYIAVWPSVNKVICSFNFHYIDSDAIECVTIAHAFKHSNNIFTGRIKPEFVQFSKHASLHVEGINTLKNVTCLNTELYNQHQEFDNRIVLPWLYGWMLVFQQYMVYLYFLALPLLGLATFDLNLKCCCGKKKRFGYRFSLIIVLGPAFMNSLLIRHVGMMTYLEILLEPKFHMASLYIMCGLLVYSVKISWFNHTQLLLSKKKKSDQQACLISNLGHNYGNIAGIGLHSWNQIYVNVQNIQKKLDNIIQMNNESLNNNDNTGSDKHAKNLNIDLLMELKKEINDGLKTASNGRNIAEMSQLILQANVKNLCLDIRKPEYEPINIRTILEWVPQLFISSKRIYTMVHDTVPNIIYIEGSVFFNCLLNLITNAMKHTVGAVRIEICYFKGEVEIRVSDEGAGIRKEDQEIIFDREMRLPGTTSYGLGIGLHSVRESLNWVDSRCHVESPYLRNVNIHNGKESGEMYGSSFWFTMTDQGYIKKETKNQEDKNYVAEDSKMEGTIYRYGVDNSGSSISGVELMDRKDDNYGVVWDFQTFKSTFNNDGAEAIQVFVAEEGDIVSRLKLALQQENYQSIARDIHKYKTSCEIIGAKRLHKLSKEIELSKGIFDINVFEKEVAALETLMNEYCKNSNTIFSILLVDDNILHVKLLTAQLEKTFMKRGKKVKIHCVKSDDPNSMGKIALERLKSTKQVYDMVLLDNQLGVRDIAKSQYFGTDVIGRYKEWLENNSLGNVEEKKKLAEEQIVHLFTFNPRLILKQVNINSDEVPWLKRCPFDKPALTQQLEMLDLSIYPRHAFTSRTR